MSTATDLIVAIRNLSDDDRQTFLKQLRDLDEHMRRWQEKRAERRHA